jgi:type I restriction enzyme S subunit
LNFQRGYDITRREQRPGDVPVVSSGGVSSYHDEAISSGPGVVIGRKGTLGRTFFLSGPYWPHDTTLWVTDFKGNDERFVYYLLRSLDFRRFDVGSANPTLNRNHIHPLEVALPPVEEQRGIAATLGALDDKIHSNRRIVDTAEQLLAALSLQLDREVPTAVLKDVAGWSKQTVSPTSYGFVDLFSIPAFDVDRLPERVTGSSVMSDKLLISEPCVLVSRLNPRTPRVWLAVPARGIPAIASTEFLALTSSSSVTLGAVWLAAQSARFLDGLCERVTGTSGSHQRVRPTDALAIGVPDVRVADDQVVATADGLLGLAHQRKLESRRLATLGDALMPELLSGRIRVPEATEAVTNSVG